MVESGRVRFVDQDGRTQTGEWTDDGIVYRDSIYDPEVVDILPPVSGGKLIGVGANHESSDEQILEKYGWPETPVDLPQYVKVGKNAYVGHQQDVMLPAENEYLYEIELAAVIGKECRNVQSENAADVIRGFTCYNDITIFDPDGDIVRQKSFDNAAPIGPVIAPPEAVPEDANMELRKNGEIQQTGNRSEIRNSEADIIEEITSRVTLFPGDIISTGAPGGIGKLHDGDSVAIEIEGVGTHEHQIQLI
jgi:2-keto-4-pentenoate hydratase/2-oxohepta-3-ene-1,7-dioic acid hydratase in catechol pathway